MARHQSGHFLLAIRFCWHLFFSPLFFFDTCATVAIFSSYDSALCPARKKVRERYLLRIQVLRNFLRQRERGAEFESGEGRGAAPLSLFLLSRSLSFSLFLSPSTTGVLRELQMSRHFTFPPGYDDGCESAADCRIPLHTKQWHSSKKKNKRKREKEK